MGDVTTPQVDDVITALELVHYLYTPVVLWVHSCTRRKTFPKSSRDIQYSMFMLFLIFQGGGGGVWGGVFSTHVSPPLTKPH